jgi:hypothetical protein
MRGNGTDGAAFTAMPPSFSYLLVPRLARVFLNPLHGTSNRNMTNNSKPRVFALKTSRKRALPASEEVIVQERTCQALRDYANNVREVFGDDQEVDWVVV